MLKTFMRPIKTLVGADLISDTVKFLQTIRDVEDVFSDHAKEMSEILHSPTTEYLGICRPIETSREQIMSVGREMKSKGFSFTHIVINGLVDDEYDIENELLPFAQAASLRNIRICAIEEYEYRNPLDIVKAMAQDLLS